MKFSLNRKIFYALFLLLIFISVFFLMIFYQLTNNNYKQNHHSALVNSNYIVDLLLENIELHKQLDKVHDEISIQQDTINNKTIELKRQQKIREQLKQAYNARWYGLTEAGQIIATASLLSLCLIIILGFLLQRWVIRPVNKLVEISRKISQGDYSERVKIKARHTSFDELDILAEMFNTMIESVENHIAEIKNTEQFLQSLLDAIPDGIRVIDRNYTVVMVNKAYEKQMRTKNFGKCYETYGMQYPCSEGWLTCPLREIKNCQSKSVNLIHNVNGRPLSVNAAPLKIKKPGVPDDFYIVEIMRDLSDDIHFSHQQKISSLGFLATSVAHEMKNNLGAVRMILENILNKNTEAAISEAEKERYLELVYKQIISSIDMPERLLRLARNHGDTKEIIDVNEAIQEVLSLLDYEAKRNGVFIFHEKHSSQIEILGSATDFKMIILNLAQNAFKAMPNGGRFSIEVSKNKNMIILQISDTGIGIAPEKIAHIFEPFYSDGQQDRGKGTGLGLAIVKALVEKLNGTITVESVVNKGTVFELKIPRVKKK